MMYIGEWFSPRLLGHLTRVLIGAFAFAAVALGALGVGAFLEGSKISSMQAEIKEKQAAISTAKDQAKEEQAKPKQQEIPRGLAAVNAFQERLNKLARERGCSITQFSGSDQMPPFISTFSAGAQEGSPLCQVEVKMNLQGPTAAVINTLKDLKTMEIPYEFTSLETSRVQTSPEGAATISAAVSLRVLTVQGGA